MGSRICECLNWYIEGLTEQGPGVTTGWALAVNHGWCKMQQSLVGLYMQMVYHMVVFEDIGVCVCVCVCLCLWTKCCYYHPLELSIIVQQDATIHGLLYFCKLLYIFRMVTPSSGAHITVITASGTGQTVSATCRCGGEVGTAFQHLRYSGR